MDSEDYSDDYRLRDSGTTNLRDSVIHKPKHMAESMDFEEMESVVWRKVMQQFSFFFFSLRLKHDFSINCGDFSKIEGLGGLILEELLHGNGL
jgi:hypothetical protein